MAIHQNDAIIVLPTGKHAFRECLAEFTYEQVLREPPTRVRSRRVNSADCHFCTVKTKTYSISWLLLHVHLSESMPCWASVTASMESVMIRVHLHYQWKWYFQCTWYLHVPQIVGLGQWTHIALELSCQMQHQSWQWHQADRTWQMFTKFAQQVASQMVWESAPALSGGGPLWPQSGVGRLFLS